MCPRNTLSTGPVAPAYFVSSRRLLLFPYICACVTRTNLMQQSGSACNIANSCKLLYPYCLFLCEKITTVSIPVSRSTSAGKTNQCRSVTAKITVLVAFVHCLLLVTQCSKFRSMTWVVIILIVLNFDARLFAPQGFLYVRVGFSQLPPSAAGIRSLSGEGAGPQDELRVAAGLYLYRP